MSNVKQPFHFLSQTQKACVTKRDQGSDHKLMSTEIHVNE